MRTILSRIAERFLSFARRLFSRFFFERQIYHRSNGFVYFTVLGPATQVALFGLTVVFSGWVAYASVNVIFYHQIVEAKLDRMEKMRILHQSDSRSAERSYDDALALISDRYSGCTASKCSDEEQELLWSILHAKKPNARLAEIPPTPSRDVTIYELPSALKSALRGAFEVVRDTGSLVFATMTGRKGAELDQVTAFQILAGLLGLGAVTTFVFIVKLGRVLWSAMWPRKKFAYARPTSCDGGEKEPE